MIKKPGSSVLISVFYTNKILILFKDFLWSLFGTLVKGHFRNRTTESSPFPLVTLGWALLIGLKEIPDKLTRGFGTWKSILIQKIHPPQH